MFELSHDEIEAYMAKFMSFRSGHISLDEWKQYCRDKLEEILFQNADVFVRMKDM